MILDGGAYAGGRVLSRDSIALLSSNQMGDVRVGAIKSVTPMSLDSEFFPGVEKSWSLAFQVNHAPLPTGRAAGGLMWAGLSNCYYWIDPASGVAGVFIAQLLPFADPAALGAYLQFETAVYDGLRRAV